MSALFYFLSWKLYKPLPSVKKLLDDDCNGEDGRNSVTMSNITEGTVIEDVCARRQSYIPAAHELSNSKPLFVYESSI